jgi:2-oxoglutarate ferredoxin oxidoreductase subunit alpha
LRRFWSGNIGIAEGALRSGCKFYAGYPITPSSDLMEYMAQQLPEHGGVFIQSEDEIAAINMIIGASIAGYKSMTATSGPGFSLMQEGIGYAVMVEVPIVIVDVMRLGPATGQATKAGQGDILQARWGRHGDQYVVVYAPSSVQECFELTLEAFNTSEKLRTPVIILVDELIAHLWETVELKEKYHYIDRKWSEEPSDAFFGAMDGEVPPMPIIGRGLNVLYTGSTHDKYGYRKTQDPIIHRELVSRFRSKVMNKLNELFIYEMDSEPNMKLGFVGFGSVARSIAEAVDILRSRGIPSGYLKLNTLWPMNYNILIEFVSQCNLTIVPELNLGQLIYDVQIARYEEVIGYNKVGGGEAISPEELVRFSMEVLSQN